MIEMKVTRKLIWAARQLATAILIACLTGPLVFAAAQVKETAQGKEAMPASVAATPAPAAPPSPCLMVKHKARPAREMK